MKRFSARDVGFYMLVILVMVFAVTTMQKMDEAERPTYSQIRLLFEQEKVRYFEVEDDILTLVLRGEEEDESVTQEYHLANFSIFYNDMHELIEQQ